MKGGRLQSFLRIHGFAAAPLAIVMFVAILTAKIEEVHTLSDFLYLSEPAFLVIFVWLVFSGPGYKLAPLHGSPPD
jgi:putative oxidoreductase